MYLARMPAFEHRDVVLLVDDMTTRFSLCYRFSVVRSKTTKKEREGKEEDKITY